MKFFLAACLLLLMVIMSLISFVLYAMDKSKAKRGLWRIPEAVLLGWGFFGGAIGALVAMKMLRHKTKHWYFWAVNILGLVIHVGIFLAVLIIV